MAASDCSRRRRWFAIAFNIVFWGIIVVGTIWTAPFLFRDGGWLAVAASAAWSFGCAITLIMTLWLESRRPKVDRLGVVVAIASLFMMILAPPVTAAILYGAEAAGGAAYVAIFAGWGTICVFALLAAERSENDAVESRCFRARFKHGPIGNWRGVRLDGQNEWQGCRIVFESDGAGQYRLWDSPEAEGSATLVPFRWRSSGENVIEVLLDDNTSKRLEYGPLLSTYAPVKLMLFVQGLQAQTESPYEIGNAERDSLHWPRFVAFDYLGEPTSSATPRKPSK